MKYEDMAVAAIAKEGTAEFSDIGRSLYPALRLRIKFSKFLQRPVLVFVQKLDPHSRCEVDRIAGRVHTFPFSFFLPFSIITDASAASWTFRRTIVKNVFARLFVIPNHIRLTARAFHGMK